MDFLDAHEASIRPLLESLDFITDTRRWGTKFRFGVFEIDEHDFNVIKDAMTD